MTPMLIAIDFDDTYTRDPVFFDLMIQELKSRGHAAICVTARMEKDGGDVTASNLANLCERIIFTGGKPKRQFTAEAGYYPSIWVDDMPETIGDHILFNFDHDPRWP